MPFDFQQLANFRLARGSHKQPNKDGNICVNEAAVIVAGFQYREIRDVSCLPDCFSRPLSEYAIYLNDFMMHRVRNELLAPFVTRLPGTSDAPWIEEQRARLIVVETVRRIVAAEYDEAARTLGNETPDRRLADPRCPARHCCNLAVEPSHLRHLSSHCGTCAHDTSYPSGRHRIVGPAWCLTFNAAEAPDVRVRDPFDGLTCSDLG